MAGLTKAERAARDKAKADAQAKQLELLQKLAKGEITAEAVQQALTAEAHAPRVITVERVKDKDGKGTSKVKIKGVYTKFPITLYASHIVKLVDEGHWEKVVTIARAIVAEEAAAGAAAVDVDAPPADAEEAPAPAAAVA